MDFAQLDHEIVSAGSPAAEGEQIAGLVQENLSPEEQNRLKEIYPVLMEFNDLMFKAQTGQYPDEAEKMESVNEQGVPESGLGETRVAQGMQSEARVPSRPVEGQVAQNAPEMMSRGGEVDISDILERDKPDWLIRALDPSTPTTKDGETIRSLTGSMDGRQILVPSIRMVDGELVRYKDEDAFRIAREKQDYLVLPAKSDKEAEAYSKALSDEFGKRRFEFGKVTQGMATGGVAAGPMGIVDKQGADGSG